MRKPYMLYLNLLKRFQITKMRKRYILYFYYMLYFKFFKTILNYKNVSFS